jgi:hypothetical protein
LSAAPLSLPVPGRSISLFAVSDPEPTILLVASSAEAVAVLQALPLSSILPSTAAVITHLANVGSSAPGTFTIALTVTQTEGGRSGIYTTEVAVPEKGVGMNLLLGTQRATAQYFGPERHHRPSTFDHLITGFAQTIPDGSAMAAFEAWLQVAEKSSPANVAYHLPETQAKVIISAVFNAALQKTEEGYRKTGVYASDIVQLLLRKKWVNDEMYPSGVVNALVQLEDWVCSGMAAQKVRVLTTDLGVARDPLDQDHPVRLGHQLPQARVSVRRRYGDATARLDPGGHPVLACPAARLPRGVAVHPARRGRDESFGDLRQVDDRVRQQPGPGAGRLGRRQEQEEEAGPSEASADLGSGELYPPDGADCSSSRTRRVCSTRNSRCSWPTRHRTTSCRRCRTR